MLGTDANTGKPLVNDAHLAQSIGIILGTPVGSRVMRRDFGSLLVQLIDQPFNTNTRIRLFGACATALMRWEPRIRLTAVAMVLGDIAGEVIVTLTGSRTDTPVPISTAITIPLQLSAVQ